MKTDSSGSIVAKIVNTTLKFSRLVEIHFSAKPDGQSWIRRACTWDAESKRYPNLRQGWILRTHTDSRMGTYCAKLEQEACENINLFATIVNFCLTSMATGPPNKVPSAPEPATSMPVDANELAVMAVSRPCLIRLSTNLDKPDFEIPPSSSSCIIVTHFPFEVSEDGDITFLKDGVWYQAGRCPKCGDVGPACVHCMRCAPRELKYNPFVNADKTVVGPRHNNSQ
jgi:hypothetical protein